MSGLPVGSNEVMTITKIGARIRDLRHAKNISQDRLAMLCGLYGGEQISRYELGKEKPRLEALAWIAMALGVDDMRDFFDGIKAEDLI